MKRGYGCLITNLLTMLVVLATCASVAYAVVVVANPSIFLNPLPPPPTSTPITIFVLASPTNTSIVSLFPTFSASFTPSPTITQTRPPTDTPLPVTPAADTPTPEPVSDTPAPSPTDSETQIAQLTAAVPTDTPEPTNTSAPTFTPTKTQSAFPFTIQGGAPIPTQNNGNSAGCQWMGIAGQAFDLNGNPIVGYWVHLEGGGLVQEAQTGTKTAYGPGGYEFFLNNRPVQTSGEYKVQLFNETGQVPLSEVIIVNTFADCNQNLLLVNFVQNH
jgi:hypothetical protein